MTAWRSLATGNINRLRKPQQARACMQAGNQSNALCSTCACMHPFTRLQVHVCMHALASGEGVVPCGRVLPYEGLVEAQPGARVALGPRSKVPAAGRGQHVGG